MSPKARSRYVTDKATPAFGICSTSLSMVNLLDVTSGARLGFSPIFSPVRESPDTSLLIRCKAHKCSIHVVEAEPTHSRVQNNMSKQGSLASTRASTYYDADNEMGQRQSATITLPEVQRKFHLAGHQIDEPAMLASVAVSSSVSPLILYQHPTPLDFSDGRTRDAR